MLEIEIQMKHNNIYNNNKSIWKNNCNSLAFIITKSLCNYYKIYRSIIV